MFAGYAVPGVVTGKPIDIGGSLGRSGATGRGVMFMTREIMHRLGKPLNGCEELQYRAMVRLVLQRRMSLANEGAKIVAISDVSGGLYCDQGILM